MQRFLLATLAIGTFSLAACSTGTDNTAPPAEQEAAATGTPEAAVTGAATTSSQVLNANTATAEQLAAARGMTPELANAIVAGRPYANVTALDTKLRETLGGDEAGAVLASVFVPVNLNSASEEEIKLIPGMTPKMVHEFLEYRPYADLTVFDREIGKYVDEAEVARLRSYVTL